MKTILIILLAIGLNAKMLCEENQKVTFVVVYTGKVQGVGFRAFVKRNADENNVLGWVANQSDGSVYAVYQGTKENISTMIKVTFIGPKGSSVDSTSAKIDKECKTIYSGFKIDD